MRIGSHVLDPDAGTIVPASGGRSRHIPPHAVATLLCLARHHGTVVARDTILQSWPAGLEHTDEALTHVIHILRDAFGDGARHSRYIRTAKNIGYALIAPIEADGAQAGAWLRDAGDHSRFLYRVAVLYWGAAWVVLQGVTLVVDLDSRAKLTLIGALILAFLVALVIAWWLQRNLYLPKVLEWLLRLVPQSAVSLIFATIIVGGLLFVGLRTVVDVNGAGSQPAPPALPAPPDKYSVAVLPFVFEGGEESYAFLADGLPDELIAVLSRLRELQVVSRTSSFYYKGRDVDLATIAQQLQVAHVVEGRVGMEQEQLRVTVTLVNAPSGRAVWSHTYRERLGSVFELYDSVMARVAQELAIEISPDLHASLAPMRPNDEEAYSLYLRGREKLQLPQEGPVLDDARDLLRAALDRDPDFARAFAGLCDTYVAQYRSTRDNALIAPAVEACNRALELDPAASEVQVAIAKLRTETGEYDAADAALQAALKRSPRSFDAYLRLGELRWGQQRLDDAEAAFKAAIDLQPGNYQGYSFYGALLVYRADYRRAEEQFSKVLSLTPDSTIALANLGGTYMLEGRLEDAVATYEKLLALQPNGQALSNLGLAYYYLGRYADAVSMLERAASLAPKDHRVLGNLAIAQSYDTRDAGAARTSYLRAIELAKERLAIDSEDADALSDLATYHAATGNRSEALSEIARAGALLPDDGATHYLAAIVHELLGDRQSALAQVHAAILAGYPRRFIEGDARLRELATFKASKGSVSGTAPVVFTAVTDWNASQDPHQAAGLDGRVIIQRPGATPFPLDVQSLVIGIAVGVAVAAVVFFTRYNVMQ